jgi:hypothetical protein
LWKHLEPEIGPGIPVLELVPGDGDCLYTAVSRYLERYCAEPPTVAALRRYVADAPLKYVAWGVLCDAESPAESMASCAEALRRPQSAYGGQLELHIMQDHYGVRYYAFDLPGGHVVSREGDGERGYDEYDSPLILLYHSLHKHYDLIVPVRDPRAPPSPAEEAPFALPTEGVDPDAPEAEEVVQP